MKLALYSAIYGDYEATAKPLPADLDIPAVMFTDNWAIMRDSSRHGWRVVYDASAYGKFKVDPANGDPAVVTPMLVHKYWKTHPAAAMSKAGLDDVDTSIWIDGNMRIDMPGAEWVAKNVAALGDDDWSLMRHPWRDCVYTEEAYTSAVCSGRYSVAALQRQIAAIEATGHPRDWGLFATGHMIRRHTAPVIETCDVWWKDNVRWSHQDQLSLPPLIWWRTGLSAVGSPLCWNANLPWGMWTLEPHGQ